MKNFYDYLESINGISTEQELLDLKNLKYIKKRLINIANDKDELKIWNQQFSTDLKKDIEAINDLEKIFEENLKKLEKAIQKPLISALQKDPDMVPDYFEQLPGSYYQKINK